MPHRNQKAYDFDFLKSHFYIGQTPEGEWRVFHSINRGRASGAGKQIRIGDVADNGLTGKGYRQCTLPVSDDGRQLKVQAHIVIWVLWHKRNVPAHLEIDHFNRNKLDNDPTRNLRAVDRRTNQLNCHRSDGPIGIEVRKRPGAHLRFIGRMVDPKTGKRVSLGYFTDVTQAQLVVDRFIVTAYGSDAPTNASLGRIGG